MELFDSHFHFSGVTDSPEEYRRKIAAAMLEAPGAPVPEKLYLLAVGGNYADSLLSRDFAAAASDAWFAAGVHPHEAESETATLAQFRALCADPLCVAVGELGLDYFYDNAPRKRQCEVLESFLGLALELKLPVVLHCRDLDGVWGAYEDMYILARDFAAAGGRLDVHCFAGSPAWAEKFLELGAVLGVTGIVTFNRAVNIREMLRVVPLERLLLETDSPYLAPVPHRGKTNTPGYLPLVAKRVAAEYGKSVEEVARITCENTFRFFGIGRS